MKPLFTVFLLTIMFTSFAQKGLDEMIATEKAFAAFSVANNTKDAFLKFMDTGAVMFRNGEPYRAYPEWQKREKRPGVLNWRPRYAEVAASGNFGISYGPWTFQPSSTNDSVIASGYFFTVWKKNPEGDWKFILDVGTDAGPLLADTGVVRFQPPKLKGDLNDMLTAENNCIAAYRTDPVKAFRQFASTYYSSIKEKSGLVNRLEHGLHADDEVGQTVAPGNRVYTPLGHGVSSSGDLGYVYGTVMLNGKKETYLRIWRHEPSGWKIAVDLERL